MRSIYILFISFTLLFSFKGAAQTVCIEATGYPSGTKSINICKGTGINITGKKCTGTGGNFQWTNLSDPNNQFFDQNPLYVVDSGKWVLTDVSIFPNSPTDTITIGFYSFDIADVNFKCKGQLMNLNVVNTTDYTDIKWFKQNITTPQASGPTYSFTIEEVTSIRVEAKHSSGCIATASKYIPILDPPLIGFTKDSSICKGDSIKLESPTDNNIWLYNGERIATTPNLYAKATGKYKLVATNNINCTSSDSINVKVNPKPEVIAGNDTIICFNKEITLKALFTSAGTTPYRFSWSPKATLSDSTNANPVAKPLVKTNYKLLVRDVNGCKDTTSITVNLYPELKATLGYTDTTVCQYKKIILKQQTTGGTPFFGSIPYIYKWRPNSTVRDSTLASPEFAPAKNEKITFNVRDSRGCEDTASLFVKISDLRVQITPQDANVCLKDSIKLNALASGGSPIYDLTWASDPLYAGISDIKNQSPWVKPLVSGLIKTTVLVRDRIGCTYKDSININSLSIPTVNLSSTPQNVCVGDSISIVPTIFTSGTAKLKYNWSSNVGLRLNADSTKATYKPLAARGEVVSLFVSAAGTCTSKKDSVAIKSFASPVIELGGIDTQTCSQTPLLLRSPISFNTGLRFLWTDDITKQQLSTDSVYSASVEGRFRLTVTNIVAGCSRNDIQEVIFQRPPAAAVISSPDTFCNNRTIKLTAIPTERLNTYAWTSSSPEINFISANNSATDLTAVDNFSGKSVISLTISNICGSNTVQKEVYLHPSPIASIELLPKELALDSTRSYFLGQPVNDTLYWRYNNSPFVQGQSTNSFDNVNLLSLSLLAINSVGCSDTATLTLEVIPPPGLIQEIFIPNVFAPQSTDSDNNALKVFGKNIQSEDFSFRVFNRWGDLLYETSDFSQAQTTGWNGSINNAGTVQIPGSYTYFVRGKFADGSTFEKSGSALLLR